jgi:glycosyltransferase involved in cell wall biosynthesis
MRILFGGALEEYQGAGLFCDLLRALEDGKASPGVPIRFDVCGFGSKSDQIKNTAAQCRCLKIEFHGNTSADEYKRLLAEADICLVLPDPRSRYAEAIIPSKFFEYMAHSKCVIVSDLADFAKLPDDIRILLQEYSAEGLLNAFAGLTRERVQNIGLAARQYAKREWSLEAAGSRMRPLIMPDALPPL